jgi:hypothetical protein
MHTRYKTSLYVLLNVIYLGSIKPQILFLENKKSVFSEKSLF